LKPSKMEAELSRLLEMKTSINLTRRGSLVKVTDDGLVLESSDGRATPDGLGGSRRGSLLENGALPSRFVSNPNIRSTNDDDIAQPASVLEAIAKANNLDVYSKDFARLMDAEDPCAHLRQDFTIPQMATMPGADVSLSSESDCVYLCGNSLGLQPKRASFYVERELDKWATLGVEGHMSGDVPWAHCDEHAENTMAQIVGAFREEVVVMNGLTVNLHLGLISFYNPTPTRYKILYEDKAFPSDHYAFLSQVRIRGLNPDDALMAISARDGEETLRTEDILQVIADEGDSIALICFSGVQYYTGQFFDIPAITRAGHDKGCTVGWDLAHAVGNVELKLHDWGVDFAAWCTYKYLNSGAGAIGGFFVHNKHKSQDLFKLVGWWGHKWETRFKMDNILDESAGARAFRIGNPSIFGSCPLLASMEVFEKTSMHQLRKKSILLTGYLELLMKRFEAECFVITPNDPRQRGAQLSVKFIRPFREVHAKLKARGVVCDLREPGVIRLAPAPLYNTFTDVLRFVVILEQSLAEVNAKTKEEK